MKILAALFIWSISATLFAQEISLPAAPQLRKGIIDATEYNFSRQGFMELRGEWEFYWNKLLTPAEIDSTVIPSLLEVPGSWEQNSMHTAIGFGTYRIRIQLPENQQGLSIYFPAINSAGRIWMNNDLVADCGSVGTTKESHVAKLASTIVPLPEKTKVVELVVQVSNFSNYNAGLWAIPKIDRNSHLLEDVNRSNGMENFFAGSLIAMFFYQLILYFLYHRGKPFLWLSLICLGVAIRALVMHGGSFLLPNLFPAVPWEIWKKLEFGIVYAIVAFFPLYIHYLFVEYAPRKPLWIFIASSTILCVVVIITPQYVYGHLLDIAHASFLLGFAYAVYSISRAWKGGNKEAKVILIGVLASFPFILLEIMKNSVFILLEVKFMYLVEMGVLVFLLFQVYLLANHHAKSYKSLELMNQNLEGIVDERTRELVAASSVRDKLLSVMSHDVRSPLNSLQGMLELYNKGHVTPEEFAPYARQIEADLASTGLLVENILVWTSSQLNGAKNTKVKFDLRDLVLQTISLFKTTAEAKQITITSLLDERFDIVWDKNIVQLAMRNLLSNAIKFSHPGDAIEVSAQFAGKDVHLRVKDEGIGIDSQTMEAIFSSKRSSSSAGTGKEKGAGLGLSLCRDYLITAGGSLTVESLKGKGSEFTIVIPQ